MLIKESFQQQKINPAEIEIFLAQLLDKDRSFIKAFPDFSLGKTQSEKLRQFLQRREKGEPFAYILGFQEFFGLKFKVDNRVMVPRPETEKLVNEVIKEANTILKRLTHFLQPRRIRQLKIVDVGTGSGNIAIALAKALPFAKIYAVEKDKKALTLAKKNIAAHKLTQRIRLLHGNLLEPLKETADIVVANLPYIPSERITSLQLEIRGWEPLISLDGGEDGREIYQELFTQAKDIIKPGGSLYYEVDGNTFTKKY